MEGGRRSSEIDGTEVRRAGDAAAERRPVGRHEIDDAGRNSGLLHQPEHQVVGQHGRVRRLPQHHVSLFPKMSL